MEASSSSHRPKRFSDSQLRRLSSYGSSTSSTASSPKFARFDPNAFNTGQSLASVLNNPRSGKNGVYGNDSVWAWLTQSSQDVQPDAPPPVPPELVSDVTKADFLPYLDRINEIYSRYLDIREHATWELSKQTSKSGPIEPGTKIENANGGVHGEGLIACLREIPPLYFDEDFSLENGETFRAACPQTSVTASMMIQEKLSHYLDMVEVHLVKEISSRSDSFFEALEQLEQLNNKMLSACDRIRDLKSTVRLLENDLVGSAQNIQLSSARRSHLLALHQKLKTIAYVNHASTTLRLLVTSSDCAGALDVIDDLKKLMDSHELVGLHCFRNLNQQLSSHTESINGILSSDFIRESLYNGTDLESRNIISSFNYKKRNGLFDLKIVQIQESVKEKISEESVNLKETLLPTIIGLIRTAKLPQVLRLYRDSLISDIKVTIRTVVSELINVLVAQINENSAPLSTPAPSLPSTATIPSSTSTPAPANELDGVNASLTSKLRDLPCETFLQLLTFVFEIVQVRVEKAMMVKNIIENVILGGNDSFEAEAVNIAVELASEKLKAEESLKTEFKEISIKGSISSGLTEKKNTESLDNTDALNTVTSASSASTTSLSTSNVSQIFRSDVMKETTEILSLACETFQNRWSKLLSVRSLTHSKLTLFQYVDTFNLTNDFIHITEKISERLGYSIRGTLQTQSKAFIDSQHNSRMTKIISYLEKETWTAIDPSHEFQIILQNLSSGKLYQPSKSADDKTKEQVKTLDQDSVYSPHENKDEKKGNTKESAAVVNDRNNKQNKTEEKSSTGSDELEKNDKDKEKKSKSKASSVQTLALHGQNFPLGSSALALLKMLEDYLEIAFHLPSMSSEVISKIVEILKIYNSRTCQLVLGAGAMQVSGLKSITAKHLALSSQCISFYYFLIPDLKTILSTLIPESRRNLFLVEIDRLAQDYKVHRDEIHSKLVGIMKERLTLRLRSLPTSPEAWNKPEQEGEGEEGQIGAFAKDLTKEVGVLHRVLSPLLLEEDLKSIFTRVVTLFHAQLAEAFSKIDITTPQAKRRLVRDVIHILQCLKSLPSSESGETQKELDKFLLTRLESN